MSASLIPVRPLAPAALLVALSVASISILLSETAESSPTPPALSDTYPLKVSTVTVRFERALDLDHNEHAYLTTTFALVNTSKASICEVWAKTTFGTDGHSRSQSLWYVKSLKPGEIRWFEDETMLDEDAYRAFKDIPLEKIATSWKTEKVKMCDGTTLDSTASGPSYEGGGTRASPAQAWLQYFLIGFEPERPSGWSVDRIRGRA